jgi:hypothetical protein
MRLVSYEDQVKYGEEAKELAVMRNIKFADACDMVVKFHDLPIAGKTIANTYSIYNSLQNKMQVKETRVVEESADEFYDREIALLELEKEISNLKSKLLNAENKNQVILYAIDKSTRALKTIPQRQEQSYVRSSPTEIAMLDLSDLHLGKKMDLRDTCGLCYYDQNVFKEQCALMVSAIKEIIHIQRTGGIQIEHLYINALGDLVDGEMIYGGHQGEIFRRTMDQIFELGDYFLMNVLVPLAKEFTTINIMAVDGNHGRVGRKKEGYDRKLNFDSFLMRFWEQRLQAHKDIFKFHISESPYMLYSLLGKLHLLSHGANKGSARYPLAGMERYLNGVSTLSRMVVDYVHLAHYHRDLKFNFNFSEILVNGSWLGPTEFSVDHMTAGDHPFQRFYGLNRKHVTWTYPIYLDKHIMLSDNNHSVSENFEVFTPTTKNFEQIDLF